MKHCSTRRWTNPVNSIKSALSVYGPLIGPSFSLPQIETQVRMQLGIDLEQEVCPLLSGEFVLDPEVEALIAPVHSIRSASHRGATGHSGQVFIAIAS